MADEDQKAAAKPKKAEKKSKQAPSLDVKKLVFGLVFVAVLAAAIYFYTQYDELRSNTAEAIQQRNVEESQRVLENLREVILVTEEEQPTVARIEDPSILQAANENFYANAQAGDYLILFPQRAIIYRESENQVINVAPIVSTEQLQAPAGTTDTDEE